MSGEVRLTFDPDGRPVLVPVWPSRRLEDEVTPPYLLDDEWDDDGGLLAFLDDGELGEEVDGQALCLLDAEENYGGGMSASLDGDVHRDDDIPPLKDVILQSPHRPLKRRFTHELSREKKGKQWAPEAVELGSRLPMLQRAHLQPQTWRPRPQMTCPVSSAPGVPLNSSETVRPVSDAPGAMKSLPETRLVSLAPGVDGTLLTTVVERRPSSRQAPGIAKSDTVITRQVLACEHSTLHATNVASPEFQNPYSVVALPLVNETANQVERTYKESAEVAPVLTRGKEINVGSRDDQSTLVSNLVQPNHLTQDPSYDQARDPQPMIGIKAHDRDPHPMLGIKDKPIDQGPVCLLIKAKAAAQGPDRPSPDQSLGQAHDRDPHMPPPVHECLGLSPSQNLTLDGPKLLGFQCSENYCIIEKISGSFGPKLDSTLDMGQGRPSSHNDPIEKGNYCNPAQPPSNFTPLPNFSWAFLHGYWTLAPIIFTQENTSLSLQKDVSSLQGHIETWTEKTQVVDSIPEHIGHNSADSGHVETEDLALGPRRSERKKKPSSRWNEEAGFIPQPPRSSKKKGMVKRLKLEEPMTKIKRSLEFMTSRVEDQEDPTVPPTLPGEF